jgi:hypothetical protein
MVRRCQTGRIPGVGHRAGEGFAMRPKTLTRAARDFTETNPVFALEARFGALDWLAKRLWIRVRGADVWAGYSNAMKAAERLDRRDEVRDRIRASIDNQGLVAQVLGRELELPP